MSDVFRRHPSGAFLAELNDDYDEIGRMLAAVPRHSGASKILKAGVESELLFVDDDSQPVPVVKDLVASFDAPWFMAELNAASGEVITDAFPGEPGMFRKMWTSTTTVSSEWFDSLGRIAPALSRVIGCGLQSVVDPGKWPQEQILTPSIRYRQATSYLTGRRQGFTFSIPSMDGGVRVIENPFSPLAASLTNGFSPNVQFPIDEIGLVANFAAATAFVAPAIASCSPFVAGDYGAWCNRIPMWAFGIDPEMELTAFAPGSYFQDPGRGAVMEWLRFIMKGEQVLEPAEVGEGKTKPDFAAMNLMIGTRWVQVGRIRFAIQDGVFTVWFESRPWDAQLFPWDNFVNLVFFAGMIAGLLREAGSAEELISYEDAKRAFTDCVHTGDCQLLWRGQKRTAVDVIKHDLVPICRRGLAAEGMFDEFAARSLEAIEARCNGLTGAHFMRAWVKQCEPVMQGRLFTIGKMSFDVGRTHSTPEMYEGVHCYPL